MGDHSLKLFGGIQMLRGVAASMVMIGHACGIAANNGIGFNDAAYWASITIPSGVDIFFVVSGFIISHSIAGLPPEDGRIRNAWAFAVKRAGRIYPVYWAVLAASVLIDPTFPMKGGLPEAYKHEILNSVFLLTPANYFVQPAWTLAYEVHFYAAASILILIDRRLAMPAALAGLVSIALFGRIDRPDLLLHPIVAEFCMGVVVEWIVRAGAKRFGLFASIVAAMFFVTGAWINAGPTNLRVVTFGVGSAFLVYAVCCFERSYRIPQWLQYPGTISYSIYLWHWSIFAVCLSTAWYLPPLIQMTTTIAAVTATAILSYRFIEAPTIQAAKAISRWSPLTDSRIRLTA